MRIRTRSRARNRPAEKTIVNISRYYLGRIAAATNWDDDRGLYDIGEAEDVARSIKEMAGFERDELCSIRALAERTPGLRGIYTSRGLRLTKDAALFSMHGERYIAVRSNIPIERVKWGVAHELGEHYLHGQRRTDIEHLANGIAGCLIMPRREFLSALRDLGEDLSALARVFCVSPTAAMLRIGETTNAPTVVLTPSFMWIRGREWVWGNEQALRAEACAKVLRPGVRKIVIETRRVALTADDSLETA